jgi:hypothetical protein
MPEIEVLPPEKELPDLNNKIVTADLEALICPKVFSAPSTAFRIWKTIQLPLLNKAGLKVYDLSQSLDSNLYGKAVG